MTADRRLRPGLTVWAGTSLALAIVLVAGSGGWYSDLTLGSPETFFWLVVVGAALCWAGGLGVVAMGLRDGLSEVAILGATVATAGGFGVVHGAAVPGVLLGPSSAMAVAGLLAMPSALLVAMPLLVPSWAVSRWAATQHSGAVPVHRLGRGQ